MPALLYAGLAAAGIAASLVFYLSGRIDPSRLAVCLALIAGAGFVTELQTSEFPSNHISRFTAIDDRLTILGTVVSEPDIRPTKTFLTVAVDSLVYRYRRISSTGRIRLRIGEPTNRFNYRDRIRFTGYLNRPYAGRNPGAFDYRRFLMIRDIYGLVNLYNDESIELVQSGALEPFVRNLVVPIREYIVDIYERYLPAREAAVMKGFLIGDVRYIPPSVYQRFKDTGTLHVLAASGANVAYVVLTVFFLLRPFGLRKNHKRLLALVAIVIFSFLAYNQPSVVRAAVMGVTLLVGRLLYRDITPLNIISFSALLILAFRPLYLYDLGFQLSYAAAFGLILFVPEISQHLPRPGGWLRKGVRGVLLLFSCTVVAQIAVTPILLYYFHKVPLVTFLSNLVIVPLVGIATGVGIVIVFISGLPGVVELTGSVLALTVKGILALIDYFYQLPILKLRSGAPPLALIAAYYAALLLVLTLWTRRRAALSFLLILVVALNVSVWREVAAGEQEDFRITFLDTWNTNTTFIREASGRCTLINGGGLYRSFDRGESVVLPFLFSQGVRKLNRVIAADTTVENLESLVSVLTGLEDLPVSEDGEAKSDSAYREQIEVAAPVIRLGSDSVSVVILAAPVSVQKLHSLPRRIDILACDWHYLESGKLAQLVDRHELSTVIITSYPNRYLSTAIIEEFREQHPRLMVFSVLESGAVAVAASRMGYRVLASPNS